MLMTTTFKPFATGCCATKRTQESSSMANTWKVYQVKMGNSEGMQKFSYGRGIAYTDDQSRTFCYDANGGIGGLRLPLDSIEKVKASRDFIDDGGHYYYPCYCFCCGLNCTGDGIVDIRGNFEGNPIHLGIFAGDSQKLAAELDRLAIKGKCV